MTKASDLSQEIAEVAKRISRAHITNATQDPEDFVVLRGSTELLIRLVESTATLKHPMPECVSGDARERNMNKPPKDDDDNRCRICGNPVIAAKAWLIHEDASGESIWRADLEDEATSDDTYGWQPIGPECAKRVPLKYRTKLKG